MHRLYTERTLHEVWTRSTWFFFGKMICRLSSRPEFRKLNYSISKMHFVCQVMSWVKLSYNDIKGLNWPKKLYTFDTWRRDFIIIARYLRTHRNTHTHTPTKCETLNFLLNFLYKCRQFVSFTKWYLTNVKQAQIEMGMEKIGSGENAPMKVT